MTIVIFQPPYPIQGSISSAEEGIRWMQTRLDRLKPEEQDLVLLPEYANTPGLNDGQLLRDFANSQGAGFLQCVAASARRLRSLIVLACPVQSGVRWVNRTLVFGRGGEIAFAYDKIHLTDAEKDDLGLTPGSTNGVFQFEEIRVGFATCFDAYFPEHFVTLASQNADIVLCPSYQRGESGERIRSMARVRALDTGSYVIRSSYAMEDKSVGGRSLVAAPDGSILKDAGADPCVITVNLDPDSKFVKPASYGGETVEHRTLMESQRRPASYRERWNRAKRISESLFPRLCAHRGLSEACPENTLPSFAAAMALGAHEIEFDLQVSRDGVLVVSHDESVDRMTDGAGKVADLSWEEIQGLDAGFHSGDAWREVRIPRLEEVLDLADGRIGLNIHIKDEGVDGSTIRQVCDALLEQSLTGIAYLALGTESALQIALDYAPDVSRACLVGQQDPDLSIDVAERFGCQRIQFFRNVTGAHISRVHEIGMLCNLFWSDDPVDGREYVERGIDVLLTNCAHTMIAGGFEGL